MSQIERFEWTNAASPAARKLDAGFLVSKVEIWDLTTPASSEWTSSMAQGSIFDLGAVPAYVTTLGVTSLSEGTRYGAAISGFTNANPGVLTVDDTATFGFAVGDTVKVAQLADNGASTSLNGEFVIASLTATTITLVEDTTAFSVYVSGGTVTRVSDTNGVPIAQENFGIQGVELGTNAVGAASASMVAMVYGENSVT